MGRGRAGQRVTRALAAGALGVGTLAVGTLAGISLTPLTGAGASTPPPTSQTAQPGSGSTTPPPRPGTQAAWDAALKTAPQAPAAPGSEKSSSGTADTTPSAPADTPSITVTPADNLVRGQAVTVTGTGLGTSPVALIECEAAAAPAFRCDYNTTEITTPDATGSIDVAFSVRRFIRGATGRVDCATAPDTCDLVVATLNSDVLVRHALAFDPTAAIANPTITVTPSTGLLAGQSVTVTGAGFLAGDFLRVSECAAVDPFCSSFGTFVSADNNGAFSTPLIVRLRVSDGAGSATHCLAVECIVRAESGSDAEYLADAPISFDPNQPLPPVPAITVNPSTGLLHDQSVTITGTGFDANNFVEISECAAATGPFCGDFLTSTQTDARGAFTTSSAVTRLVSAFGPGGTSIVDCAVAAGCTINAAGFSSNDSFELVANAPISFDDSVPPPALPVVTVTPSANLPYRAQVAVHGTGFRPGEFVFADFCAQTTQSGGCGNSSSEGTADASGTVDFTLNVKRRLFSGGVTPIDCIDVGTTCSVSVQGQRQYERTQVPVTFDPNSPIPPPPTATITPDHDLGFRQTVTLAGSGFTPGTIPVEQCGLVSFGGGGTFLICRGFTQVEADANGAISGTAEVRRVLTEGPGLSVDCATSAQPCTLRVGSGDPDETATVPLAFDPNSQPPPPPAVTVSPATHLLDGQNVTVSGTGFTPGALLGMAPCNGAVTEIADACDIGRASVVTADASGAFSTTVTAAALIGTAQGPVDCTVAPDTCSIAVANANDLTEFARASLSFDTPGISVHSVTVTEGTGANTEAPVMVELSQPSLTPTTVEWQAIPGTAGVDDYMETRGRVTIPAGATEAMIHLEIVGDAIDEPTEHFTVQLTSAPGTHIVNGTATVKIRDDDHAPRAVIADARVGEGDGLVQVPVMLTAPSGRDITIEYRTHHGSARSGSDFVRGHGSITIPAGQIVGIIPIGIVDDTKHERTERFTVKLDRVDGAGIARGSATVTIIDND